MHIRAWSEKSFFSGLNLRRRVEKNYISGSDPSRLLHFLSVSSIPFPMPF